MLNDLEALLPPREELIISDDAEEADLCDADLSSQQRAHSVESYEEDEGPRGGVQCHTQWWAPLWLWHKVKYECMKRFCVFMYLLYDLGWGILCQ